MVLQNLETMIEEGDESLTALGNGWYQVSGENGEPAGRIETVLLEGTHKDICIICRDRITERLYGFLEGDGE